MIECRIIKDFDNDIKIDRQLAVEFCDMAPKQNSKREIMTRESIEVIAKTWCPSGTRSSPGSIGFDSNEPES